MLSSLSPKTRDKFLFQFPHVLSTRVRSTLPRMAPVEDWDSLFRNEAFVNNYETGEKVTVQFAKTLLDQSGLVANTKLNPEKPLIVLDNACGTGVVSSILQHELDHQVKKNWHLTCADISEGMLECTRRRMAREAWLNAETKQVDAQETKLPTGTYTHVLTAFGEMSVCHVLYFANILFFSLHGSSSTSSCPRW